MYLAAIVFTNKMTVTYESEDMVAMFDNLGRSMLTLLTRGMLLDELTSFLDGLLEDNLFMFCIFVGYMLMSAITMMNMLLGILCTVVFESTQEELEKNTLDSVRNNLVVAFGCLDASGDGMLTRAEFESLTQKPTAQEALKALGIDETNFKKLLDSLFAPDTTDSQVDEYEEWSIEVTPAQDCGMVSAAGIPGALGKGGAEGDSFCDGRPAPAESKVLKKSDSANTLSGRWKMRLSFEDFVEAVISLRPKTLA